MILEETVDLIKQIYKINQIIFPKINNVVVGLGYTCVEVYVHAHKSFLGLASILPNVITNTDCSKINFAGELTNYSIEELLNWSFEAPNLKKIIGIAALNAVSQHVLKFMNTYRKVENNILKLLNIHETTKVTFIGLMKPIIRNIAETSKQITIIEDSISISPEFKKFKNTNNLNQLEENDLHTDILFCTGSALINNTLESILEKFKRKAQKIILIGPTASLIPDILFDYGVDIVCGMEIFDSRATMKVVQEGGGTKLFKKYGKKYNLIKD
ncbi:MAG: Rossmann-like domain-containing protein [Promethearchaeota archaeon]